MGFREVSVSNITPAGVQIIFCVSLMRLFNELHL